MHYDLVAQFKAAKLPQSEWNHRAHLIVALHYLDRFSPPEALDRLRADIQTLNVFHGVYTTPTRGYHETRTRVWLAVLLHELRQGLVAEEIVDKYARHDVLQDFYSPEVLESLQARIAWVRPDKGILPIDPAGWCECTPPLFTMKERATEPEN